MAIFSAVAVLPVNEMRGTSGCWTMAAPVSGPVPNTRLQTPGGSPKENGLIHLLMTVDCNSNCHCLSVCLSVCLSIHIFSHIIAITV